MLMMMMLMMMMMMMMMMLMMMMKVTMIMMTTSMMTKWRSAEVGEWEAEEGLESMLLGRGTSKLPLDGCLLQRQVATVLEVATSGRSCHFQKEDCQIYSGQLLEVELRWEVGGGHIGATSGTCFWISGNICYWRWKYNNNINDNNIINNNINVNYKNHK